MVSVDEVRKAQRAEGTATIMAIGTTNPPNVYDQSSYPDTYFRMTNTEHMTEVKYKMQRMCCNGGGTILPIAKDLAENNRGSRVLIVCTEITLVGFHCPTETDVDVLVSHSLFADGSAALIVGADPILGVEKPIFELVSTAPTLVPNSPGAICGSITDWNSVFWEVHIPQWACTRDQVEAKLGLKPEKKKSAKDGLKTTGDGFEWGVLFGFGLGLIIEALVLHSVNIA
ncbi:hypothetical protein Pint_25373 [Pistacia integerrima]|uniref:Uncharacterized protein n=1 Tax=Pistacia integerrima TaxID=434235 RepID=A0ACC0YGZ9_9ROSI|nr:hypothetical protein Pint_25373 [Pistacia integerrima]